MDRNRNTKIIVLTIAECDFGSTVAEVRQDLGWNRNRDQQF
jgi:hypothetical protein